MNIVIKKGVAALQLIRPLNLAFIALTQYLLFFHFLFPILHATHAPVLLEGWRALVFLITTTLLTAAGYGINDYFDVETDRINKPDKWLVGNRLSPKTTAVWVAGLVILGAILSAWLAWDIQKPVLWLIYPVAVFLLWSYSRYLKGIPLAGNLLIALLCMMVGGIIWFAEREGIAFLRSYHPQLALQLIRALVFYLFFAFLATLFREMVKDCEDMEGDAATAQQTLPVRFGLHRVKRWALAGGLLLEIALLLLAWYFHQTSNVGGIAYTLSLLAIPQLAGLWFCIRLRRLRTIAG
ncbi:MAG: geranylgeranylglycerol-phosphate geranylgeranyltransferase [Saprospirales bacterium]|nr:geranylgeranylglycerol-phosphate geranylgeranyltransferase [Saprospirales bacterium]